MEEEQYVERAKTRIRDILEAEHAVVHPELEARISEGAFASSRENIDPHHVTTALKELTDSGEVVRTPPEQSRGSHPVPTIQPADQRRRTTAIARAARRKRLLYSRYLGWAIGTKRHPQGLIGPAGEQAMRSAVLEAQTLIPATPDAGEVRRLLNHSFNGPLDSGGWLLPFVDGLPTEPVTVLIEVKNIRNWIYPSAQELYQLLSKGAALQQANPDHHVLPVLICRKAQKTTFFMAAQLGFVVIDMEAQFVGHVEGRLMDEVRNELGFQDLRTGAGPSQRVRDRFAKTLPHHALKFASRWRTTAANTDMAQTIQALRSSRPQWQRTHLMDQLRQQASAAGHRGGF